MASIEQHIISKYQPCDEATIRIQTGTESQNDFEKYGGILKLLPMVPVDLFFVLFAFCFFFFFFFFFFVCVCVFYFILFFFFLFFLFFVFFCVFLFCFCFCCCFFLNVIYLFI